MFSSYYILDQFSKRVFEFPVETYEKLKPLFSSMLIPIHFEFPYEAAGYEDPYSFMEDYQIITFAESNGDIVEIVEVEENV